MSQQILDRRRNAFRDDLADIRLEDLISTRKFVSAEDALISVPVCNVHVAADVNSSIDTQFLLGEPVLLFERTDEYAWVQSKIDGYVGYVRSADISELLSPPTHMVTAIRSFLYYGVDLRSPLFEAVSFGSRLVITGETEIRGTRYFITDKGHGVIAAHCTPLDEVESGKFASDPVEVCARFVETPYLWGGRSGLGIDCSGLVQLGFMACGLVVPRDSDMQAAEVGEPLDESLIAAGELQRGDLVFWKGHVGLMEDARTLLHANGYTMTVIRENFHGAVERIASLYARPTGCRRPVI